jgi:hypothetical protein
MPQKKLIHRQGDLVQGQLQIHKKTQYFLNLLPHNPSRLLFSKVTPSILGKIFASVSEGSQIFIFSLVFCSGDECSSRHRPATSPVHYATNCNTQSSAPEDGQNNARNMLS